MKEEAADLLKKASRAIRIAEKLFKDGDLDFAAGRAYYAMFYTAKALLFEKGFRRFTKHMAVHSAFGENFSKPAILDPNTTAGLSMLLTSASKATTRCVLPSHLKMSQR